MKECSEKAIKEYGEESKENAFCEFWFGWLYLGD